MAANPVDDFVHSLLQQYTNSKGRFLDIGCGPAPYKTWVRGEYIGLDVTDEPYGIDMPRCVDVVGSAMNLPLKDASVDLIFSKSAFFLAPDPDRVLREAWRVLTPGGRLLLLDYNRRAQRRLQAAEKIARPCWTQWELRKRVSRVGFHACELLPPTPKSVGSVERTLRLLHQELFGIWAIVTAVK